MHCGQDSQNHILGKISNSFELGGLCFKATTYTGHCEELHYQLQKKKELPVVTAVGWKIIFSSFFWKGKVIFKIT